MTPPWNRRLSALVFTLTLLLACGPLAALGLASFPEGAGAGATAGPVAVFSARRLQLLAASVQFSLACAATCTVLSWLIGSWLWRRTAGRPLLASRISVFIWFLALLPPYVHSYAWMAVTGGFSGIVAAWWTQSMVWLPLALSLALFGFRSIEPDLVDAARLAAPPSRVFLSVVTPLAAPALLAGGAMVFLLSLQEYGVPSLFQVGTYAMELFADYSAYHDHRRVLLLSVPAVLIGAAVLAAAMPAFRRISAAVPRPERGQHAALNPPFWIRSLQAGAVGLLVVQIGMPFAALVRTAAWDRLAGSLAAAVPEIMFSLQTALLSSALATAAGLVYTAGASPFCRRGALPLAALPLSFPGTLTGMGLVVLFSQAGPAISYGGDGAPVAAALARFGPLALLIALAQESRIDPRLLDAARFFQASSWRVWWKIRWPLVRPGAIAAFAAVFLLTLGELSATLMVLPPGRSTLSVRIYNLLHYGASDAVAGLCLFLVLSGWLIGFAAVAASSKQREGGWR